MTGNEYIADYMKLYNVWYYFIRLDFLKRLGLLFVEGVILEDIPFTTELFLNAEKMVSINTIVYFYVTREDSYVNGRSSRHIRNMIDGLKFAAESLNEILIRYKNRLSEKARQKLIEKRDFCSFFMYLWQFRYVEYREIKHDIRQFKVSELYPIMNFPNKDYKSFKYRILTTLINSPIILLTLKRIYSLKFNPKF